GREAAYAAFRGVACRRVLYRARALTRRSFTGWAGGGRGDPSPPFRRIHHGQPAPAIPPARYPPARAACRLPAGTLAGPALPPGRAQPPALGLRLAATTATALAPGGGPPGAVPGRAAARRQRGGPGHHRAAGQRRADGAAAAGRRASGRRRPVAAAVAADRAGAADTRAACRALRAPRAVVLFADERPGAARPLRRLRQIGR